VERIFLLIGPLPTTRIAFFHLLSTHGALHGMAAMPYWARTHFGDKQRNKKLVFSVKN
jgi:hypothetical protein